MVNIDDNLISKLENLAKLSLSEEEKEIMKKDLRNILAMIDKLSEVDTANVEPLRYLTEEKIELRVDEVAQELSTDEGLKNAPVRVGNYFAVPKVIN